MVRRKSKPLIVGFTIRASSVADARRRANKKYSKKSVIQSSFKRVRRSKR